MCIRDSIKNTYYDDYSKVEEMYEMLNYVDTSAAPALFRFAIEYNLDDLGLEIRLPASLSLIHIWQTEQSTIQRL